VSSCRATNAKTTVVKSQDLRFGKTVSCGCFRLGLKPRLTHGGRGTPEYSVWSGMWKRCTDRAARGYKNYGGRGISVCVRWADFALFLEDVGRRPSAQHSIDRINNDGNYEPGNCRWATTSEQSSNRRTTVRITICGEVRTMSDWARLHNLSPATAHRRIKGGWDPIAAVTIPRRGARPA